MTVLFADHFWGEKHVGLSVLYGSLKTGTGAVKELADFLKDRAALEEEAGKHQSKSLAKAAHFANSDHTTKDGWNLTKNAVERLQQGQVQLASRLGELLKEVGKYGEELGKKHRELKNQESSSFEAANLIQTTTTCLQKSKETYATRCVEAEKLRRDSASPKEIAKAEKKTDKAREEYKANVEKYEEVRAKFTAAMESSATKFQEEERQHLDRMRSLMATFAKHTAETHSVAAQVCEELSATLTSLDIDAVLGEMVEKKGTGTERPEAIAFEEPDLEALLPPPPTPPSAPPDLNGLNSAFVPSQPALLDTATKPGTADADLLNLGDDQSVASSTSSSTTATKESEGTQSRSKLRLHLGSWNSRKSSQSPATTPADPNNVPASLSSVAQPQPESTEHSVDLGGEDLPAIDDEVPVPAKERSHIPQASPRLIHSLKAPLGPSRIGRRTHGSLPTPLRLTRPPSNTATFSAYLHRHPPPPRAADFTAALRPHAAITVNLSPAKIKLRRSETFAGSSTMPRARPEAPVTAPVTQPRAKILKSSLSFSKGFFKKKTKKKSASKLEGDLSKFPPEKSLDGDSPQPNVDAEGYIIREETSNAPPREEKDSDTSSDDDEDTTRKIRVKINPLSANGVGKGAGSLSDIISGMGRPYVSTSALPPLIAPPAPSLPAPLGLPKSKTMDERDPWAPGGGTMGAPPKVPMRPSLTGDGRLNIKEILSPTEAERQEADETVFGEGDWPMPPSLTGSSSRPRPRPTTPTNFFSLHSQYLEDGGSSFSRSDSLASLGEDSVLGGSQYFATPGAKLPLAMALTETVHAIFAGTDTTKCRIRVFGSIHVSFPGSAIQSLLSPTPPLPLTFKLTNAARLQALIPNKQVLASGSAFASSSEHEVIFDAGGLAGQLKRLSAAKPGAPFYNLEVLRYEVRAPTPPLLLQLWWKSDATSADIRIDYRLNPANQFSKAMLNPTFTTGITGGKVTNLVAKPEAEMSGDKLIWRLTTLSSLGESEGDGSLKGRLSTEEGPLLSSPTALSFSVADTTLSGATLEVRTRSHHLRSGDKLIWRLTTLSSLGESEGDGSLKGRLSTEEGPLLSSPTALSFSVADTTLSGATLEVRTRSHHLRSGDKLIWRLTTLSSLGESEGDGSLKGRLSTEEGPLLSSPTALSFSVADTTLSGATLEVRTRSHHLRSGDKLIWRLTTLSSLGESEGDGSLKGRLSTEEGPLLSSPTALSFSVADTTLSGATLEVRTRSHHLRSGDKLIWRLTTLSSLGESEGDGSLKGRLSTEEGPLLSSPTALSFSVADTTLSGATLEVRTRSHHLRSGDKLIWRLTTLSSLGESEGDGSLKGRLSTEEGPLLSSPTALSFSVADTTLSGATLEVRTRSHHLRSGDKLIWRLTTLSSLGESEGDGSLKGRLSTEEGPLLSSPTALSFSVADTTLSGATLEVRTRSHHLRSGDKLIWRLTTLSSLGESEGDGSLKGRLSTEEGPLLSSPTALSFSVADTTLSGATLEVRTRSHHLRSGDKLIWRLTTLSSLGESEGDGSLKGRLSTEEGPLLSSPTALSFSVADTTLSGATLEVRTRSHHLRSGDKLIWRLTTLSSLGESEGDGSLKGRLSTEEGPLLSSPTALSFSVADTTLSGATLEVRTRSHHLRSGDKLIWRLTTLSSLGESEGDGSLKGRLSTEEGPLLSSPTALSFSVADTTLSGATLEVSHDNYRLSLLKKKMVSGKYTVEKAPN